MSAPDQASRRSARLAALVIAAIALLQLWLVCVVLNPRTFFANDSGVKYLQALTLAESGWRQWSLRAAADDLGLGERFSPLAGHQFLRRAPGAPRFGVYSELFTLPVSVSLALFGVRGLYVVPALASLGTMLLSYRLARRYAARTAWVAALLVGACSPMLFYSVDLWEHTLAAMFATAAIMWFVAGITDVALWRATAAGVALGAAIVVREELYCLAVGMVLALAWVDRRRRLRAALALAGGASLVVIPHWLLKWFEYGRPVRLLVQVLFYRVLGVAPFGLPESARLAGKRPSFDAAAALNVPLEAAWLLPLAAMIALRWWFPRADARLQKPLLVGLTAAAAVWAIADAAFLVHTWARPDAFVQAFPVALFLLFLPPPERQPNPLRGEIRILLTIAVLFAILAPSLAVFALSGAPLGGAQWGPRFLLPLCPLLAAVIVFAFERRAAWRQHVAGAPRLLAAAMGVLMLAGAVTQVQGLRQLRIAKLQYERLVQGTEELEPQSLVATDLWWFPTVIASVLDERPTVVVEAFGNGSLADLLPYLNQRSIGALTLVSGSGGLAERNAAALARAGWIETARQRVPIWLDVDFVSYRRAD